MSHAAPGFADRRDAGRQLGALLRPRGYVAPVVLGLPRGGVPVAYEVANALNAPLDVFVVRKLGVPRHEELAMGAIASGGVQVIVPHVVEQLGIRPDVIEAVSAAERIELARREREYRGARPFPVLKGRTAIIVDDGVATGASMIAALQAVRALGPAAVVAAVPVASRQARDHILQYADACIAVLVPDDFAGVGEWYGDFSQTADEDVRALLHEAHARIPAPASPAAPADGWRIPT